MRHTSLLFRAATEASTAAAIVARLFPAVEVEVDDARLHLYAEGDRPLWGEILLALRQEGIHPVRPRPTWAGRLATLARRCGLEAYAAGDAVCLTTGDADAVVALAEAASRRGLCFSALPHGGDGEYDPRIVLRLFPGPFGLDALLAAIETERLRIEHQIRRWRP